MATHTTQKRHIEKSNTIQYYDSMEKVIYKKVNTHRDVMRLWHFYHKPYTFGEVANNGNYNKNS